MKITDKIGPFSIAMFDYRRVYALKIPVESHQLDIQKNQMAGAYFWANYNDLTVLPHHR